jgi:hypothetical protein
MDQSIDMIRHGLSMSLLRSCATFRLAPRGFSLLANRCVSGKPDFYMMNADAFLKSFTAPSASA